MERRIINCIYLILLVFCGLNAKADLIDTNKVSIQNLYPKGFTSQCLKMSGSTVTWGSCGSSSGGSGLSNVTINNGDLFTSITNGTLATNGTTLIRVLNGGIFNGSIFTSYFNTKTTSNLSEGTNLYYTGVRVNGDIAQIFNTNGFLLRTGLNTYTGSSVSLTGDVTGSGTTSITTTIANSAITSGKISNGGVNTADIASSITLTTPNIGVATGTSLTTTGKLVAGTNVNGTVLNASSKVISSGVVNGTNATFSGTGSYNKVLVTNNVNGAVLRSSGKIIATTNINGTTANLSKVLSSGNINGTILNASSKVISSGVVNGTNLTFSGTATVNKLLSTNNVNGAVLRSSGKIIATTNINGTTANLSKVLSSGVVNGTNANFTKVLASGSVNGATANMSKVISSGTVNGKRMGINGNLLQFGSLAQGSILFAKQTGVVNELTKGTNHYALKVNGNTLAWEVLSSSGGTPGGSNTWFQYNDSGSFAGNGALTFTKASKTLAVAANAPFDINSTTVSIADTDITLDGATTTFTQTGATGTLTMSPKANANFVVQHSQNGKTLFDNSSGSVIVMLDSASSYGNPSAVSIFGDSVIQFTENGHMQWAMGFHANGDQFRIDDSHALANGRFVIKNDGNIGIGTTTPSYKLDINGNTRSSGKIIATSNINGTTANLSKVLSSGVVNGTTANMSKVLSTGVVNGTTANFSKLISTGTTNGKRLGFNGNLLQVGSLAQGSILTTTSTGIMGELAKGTNHYALKVNGNRLAWEALSAASSTPNLILEYGAGEFFTVGTNGAPLTEVSLGNGNALALSYDDTTEEYAYIQFIAPSDLNTSGTVTIRCDVSPVTGAASKNIGLTFSHQAIGNGVSMNKVYTDVDTGAIAITSSTRFKTNVQWSVSVSTLGWAANDLIRGRLSRDPSVTNDLTGDMYLWGCRFAIPRT